MEFLILVIIFVLFIVAISNKEKKSKKNADIVRDLLNQHYQTEIGKLEEEVAEKQSFLNNITSQMDSAESDKEYAVLITMDVFEGLSLLLKDTCDMIMDICRENDFQKYVLGIKEGNDDIDNSQKMFSSLKFFIIQDVLRSFERLGHRYYTSGGNGEKNCNIEYDTDEGQLLYGIVSQMMSYDDNKSLTWEDFKSEISSNDWYSMKIRKTAIEALNTYANADVKATASNGLDDFAFCIILHNYNKDYENTYRKKMLRIATIIANADGKVTDVENQWLDDIMNVGTTEDSAEEKNEVENPDEELNCMIGLSTVKDEINTLCNFVIMKKRREEEGLKSPNISYHCVFSGNPGTGKTTVARLLAGIYKDLGVLKKGHLEETDRSGLVAEYVGQTAVKTNKIIDSALDGVLFIDEAYTLANGGTNDYGPEAIATLLKRMEDDRDRLVVILAGYNKEIESFINSNPGLRSRFNRYIHFEDYTAEELFEIFCLQIKKSEYILADDAAQYLKERLAAIVTGKPKDFGNARYVRNLFEKAIEAQANRLASMAKLTKEDLKTITKADLYFDDNLSGKKEKVSLNHDTYLEAKRKTNQKQQVTDIEERAEESNSEKVEQDVKSTSSYSDYDETIEVSYTVSGLDDVSETTIDVEIKERDYDWLSNKEDEGEYLDSDYVSENRRGLHRRILRAIRDNIEESYDDIDLVEDDDIEYTVSV